MKNGLLGRVFAAALLLLVPAAASAQTAPNWTYGYVPTTAQWNAVFASKQDLFGYVPMNVAGGSFTGRVVTPAAGASTAGFNLTPGGTPAAPANGDLWTTSSGMFVRINGSTVGPLGSVGTGANTYTDTQTINPPTGTIHPGLMIGQTLPSSGTPPGPVVLNSITITNPGLSTSGSGWDAFGQGANQIIGLKVNYAATGAGTTNNAAFAASTFVTGATDAYGSLGAVIVNANVGSHYQWGHIGAIGVWPSGAAGMVVGVDAEVGIATGGSALWRFGVGADSQGPVQGSTLDAAFVATASSVTVPGGGVVVGWQHLMAISKNVYFSGVPPIAPTGDFFFSDSAMTVAHFANLNNVTVTGNILGFPNVAVGGGGTAVFGRNSGNLPTTGLIVFAPSGAASGNAQVFGGINNATGANGLVSNDTSGNVTMGVTIFEASNTTSRFGQAAASWGQVITTGSANAGLMTGTLTAAPYVIGTNNTPRITVTGAGVTTIAGITGVGGGTAPDATLTVNSNTGATVAPNVSNGLHLVAADSANGGIISDVFGGVQNIITARAAAGTRASKAAVGATVGYFGIYGEPYNGTTYVDSFALEAITINAQSGSDSSSRARLRLVPSGSTTLTDVMLWGPGVAIGSGAADPGAGNLNLGGGVLQNNGTAPTGTGAYVRATAPTVSALVVTGSFTATGLVTNADLASSSLTVNGTSISLGASGTVTAAAGTLTGATLASNVLASSLTSVGTLTGGATGAGFTIALGTSTVSGTLPCANLPALTGDVATSSCAATLATAQPAVHTWALAQTFTVAPVFTDASGSRAALGLGTMATQAASAVAVTGGTINGAVIGGSTPAAVTATTLTGNTSVTSPLHIGGAGASSTLTLESTSGAGTTDAIIMMTASQVERARITTGGLFNIGPAATPDSLLTINANTVATSTSGSTYPVHIIGANTANAGFITDAFGAGGVNVYTGRTALGTAASPTQITGATVTLSITGQALDDTGTYRSSSVIDFATLGAVTSTSAGGFVRVRTITSGTASLSEKVRVASGLMVGSTNDGGLGTVLLLPQTFSALSSCSSTTKGATAYVTDSTTATWGATITGSGANPVLASCNGANWTVAAK